MSPQPTWGVVATIKAPASDVLAFVAFHLEAGASQIFIFLDDDNPIAQAQLRAHPKVRVIRTDETYWQDRLGRRPEKHQVRQVRNASRAYRMAKNLDWIAHIDVDEFLCADTPIADQLLQVGAATQALRLAPYESLCHEGDRGLDLSATYCKAKFPGGRAAKKIEQHLYPQFGGLFKSGFISHTAGKVMVRTGLNNVRLAIHRAFEDGKTEIPTKEITGTDLCHQHVASWEKWRSIMDFRLKRGSYRAELQKDITQESGRMSKHSLFSALTAEGSHDLRAFFEETCLATPELTARLEKHGLLRVYHLDLLNKLRRHFPEFNQ